MSLFGIPNWQVELIVAALVIAIIYYAVRIGFNLMMREET